MSPIDPIQFFLAFCKLKQAIYSNCFIYLNMRTLLPLVIFNIVFFVYFGKGEILNSNLCTSRTNCSDCIRGPECSWCLELGFKGTRCNTAEGHNKDGCQNLYTPENVIKKTKDYDINKDKTGKNALLRPQEVSIKLRKGVPAKLVVEYTRKDPKDAPLDLYYLMDLTRTMMDDQKTLSELGTKMVDSVRPLTESFRQGFGSFIDKVTMPYIRMTENWLKNPCTKDNYTCAQAYGFKNHLPLSSDSTKFSKEIGDARLSTSLDKPEGGFDALMQTLVCSEKIGWKNDSRKVVIFATDAPSHLMGDGKLGGIIRRNDGECHLNNQGEYTQSTEMDYPSISQLSHKAMESEITIIFAVTEDQTKIYSQLAEKIEGAESALLSNDSSNIVHLVVEQYKKITSKVEMNDNAPKEFINLKYFTSCLSPIPEFENKVCEDLPIDSTVKFTVEMNLENCPNNPTDWKQSFKIYPVSLIGLGVSINLEMLCDCPCEKKDEKKSKNCGGVGTEKCGLCECYEPHFGKLCECSANNEGVPSDEYEGCRAVSSNSSEVCSGRGACNCGQCDCDIKDDGKGKFSGPYCECDNFSCDQINDQMCAGNGVCVCGKCNCASGWNGNACDCSTNEGTCVRPGTDDLCSNKGTCKCGKCKCKGRYSGTYCEKCLHEKCPTKCADLTPCVQCTVHGTGLYGNENSTQCLTNCKDMNIQTTQVISQETSSDSKILCKAVDETDQCAFHFVYEDHDIRTVVIDAQKTKECPPTPPIYWILFAIIAIIVVAGLCVIIAWKLYTIVSDRREYANFESERKNASFARTDNPIYHNPVGTYENPVYGKQKET